MMKQRADSKNQLYTAIIAAFGDRNELWRAVAFRLNDKLDIIAPDPDPQ
jgi:hypothetical protein